MIKITSTNDVIIVEGDELTRHYPNNGTLVIPKNSTIVVLDEKSEMVLFKSASNYDTLFTGILGSILIEDELVTRDNIIEKFNAISNVLPSGGSGGNLDLFEVVQSLPTENISDNKIYLVIDSNGSEGNTYVEYLYVNGQWEELGKFKVNVDLSGYATEDWVNSQGFLKEHQDISNLATKQELATKQDVISDLETIRSGAAKGATALQSVPSEYVTETELNNKGYLTSVPDTYATEQWVNEQGFLKEHQDISNLATKQELATKQDVITDLDSIRSGASLGETALQSVPDTYALKSDIKTVNGTSLIGNGNIELATKSELATKQDVISDLETIRSGASLGATALQTVPSGYTTEQWVNEQGFLKEHQDISNLATKEELNAKQDTINDLETIRNGAAKGATALQSVPSEYVTETELNNKGYLTSVPDTYALKSEIPDITTKQDTLVSGTNIKTINGTSLLGSGNIEVAANVDLSSYATKEELNAKQDTLVSGTNIKTINGNSLLGSGDITIEGGSGNVDLTDYYTKTETNELVNPKLEQITLTQAEYDALQTKENNVLYIISDAEDLKFKTINGQQITGEGNIEVAANVDLSDYATKSELATKQDTISDLQTIRSGASKGATALQSVPDTYALKSDIKTVNGTSLIGNGNIELATKSELNTKQDAITDLDSIRSGAAKGATALQSVPNGYATEQWVNEQGFLKEHQDISNLATKDELNAKQDTISDLDTIRSGASLGATALQSVPSTYALKTDIPDITTKQDTLVSGTNIKTVNGTSLLGSGDITIEGGADLSGYYTKAEIDSMIGGASTTITQINNLVG